MQAVLLDNTARITQLGCRQAVLFSAVTQYNVIVYKTCDTAQLSTSCVISIITQLDIKWAVLFCRTLSQSQTQSQSQSEVNRSHSCNHFYPRNCSDIVFYSARRFPLRHGRGGGLTLTMGSIYKFNIEQAKSCTGALESKSYERNLQFLLLDCEFNDCFEWINCIII